MTVTEMVVVVMIVMADGLQLESIPFNQLILGPLILIYHYLHICCFAHFLNLE